MFFNHTSHQSLWVTGVLGLLLVGCASQPTQHQSHRVQTTTKNVIVNSQGVPNWYQVKAGDTVSKIAKRYGLDWREVARINRLNDSYTIHTDQWLLLWTGSEKTARPAQVATTTRPQVVQPTTPRVQSNPPRMVTSQQQTQSAPTPPQLQPRQQPPVQTQPRAQMPTGGIAPFASGSSGVMQFRYPVQPGSPVVRRFGRATVAGKTHTSNGMWFYGQDGDPVYASRAGTVIHADANHLQEPAISIQHTDGFVSSYIYIKGATVKAGDTVQPGQKIASMKLSNEGVAIFEFRVARHGVYVDPLTVLK